MMAVTSASSSLLLCFVLGWQLGVFVSSAVSAERIKLRNDSRNRGSASTFYDSDPGMFHCVVISCVLPSI